MGLPDLFGAFGLLILAYALLAFLVPFGVIYVLGWTRRMKGQSTESVLGARVLLTLLMSVAVQIALFGAYRMFAESTREKPKSSVYESAAISAKDTLNWDLARGTFWGGIAAALYPTGLYVLLRRRMADSDTVLRSALGVNAIFTGLVFVASITGLMICWNSEPLKDACNEFGALTGFYLLGSLAFSGSLIFLSLAPPVDPSPTGHTRAPSTMSEKATAVEAAS